MSQQFDLLTPKFKLERNRLSLRVISGFLNIETSEQLLDNFIQTTVWQQPRLKVYGKWHPTPRLVSFYGDHLAYQYSNTLHHAQAWTPTLLDLKSKIEQETGTPFNSVLLNYYRDGQDTMGWHADDERELGKHPTIASLSLGAPRDMHFKPKPDGELIKLNLSSGCLLIMSGETQQAWQHHIPKRATCTKPRVNLTFRNIYALS